MIFIPYELCDSLNKSRKIHEKKKNQFFQVVFEILKFQFVSPLFFDLFPHDYDVLQLQNCSLNIKDLFCGVHFKTIILLSVEQALH